ncbi:helix-turn-helix transcriptional regulator [Enterococcus sp. LJL99]
MKVINTIRETRKQKKITQGELAKAVKVSRQTIIAIENGKYNPSLELSLKLVAFFNCSFDEIFYLEDKE